MPTVVSEVATATAFLKARRLTGLRCRAHAGAIIIESGPKKSPDPLVRLKKLTGTVWTVEEFNHTGRWSPLPIQAPLPDALAAVAADFPWLLDA